MLYTFFKSLFLRTWILGCKLANALEQEQNKCEKPLWVIYYDQISVAIANEKKSHTKNA